MLGGNESPSAEDIKGILDSGWSVGVVNETVAVEMRFAYLDE